MSKRAFAVLLACFFTILISYAVRYGYGVILPEMLPAMSITKTEAGVIFAAFFIAYTIFSPLVGVISDRYDVRLLISVFVALLGIGTMLMSYSSSVITASLFFTLAGIGSTACWTPVMAVAQRWVSDKRRGITLAAIDAGSSLGIVAGGTLVPLIVISNDWRAGWMSLGLFACLVAVVDFFLIRSKIIKNSSPGKNQPGSHVSLKTAYLQFARDSRFWLIGIAYLFTGFSIILPFTFLSTYAVQELSFPYQSATRLMMVVGVSATVFKLIMGYFSDAIGRMRVMLLCAVLISLGCWGITLKQGSLALILSTIVFGCGYGACWSMYAAIASDYFSKEVAGGIIGLWTLLLGIGSLISPIIAGWLADTTGTLVWSFYLAMTGGILSLILLIIAWRKSVCCGEY
jgi:MFS family permease